MSHITCSQKTAATTTTTTTGRKRKASSKLSSPTSSKKRKEQQYLLLNQKIPSRIQCKIDVLLQDVLLPEAEEGTKTGTLSIVVIHASNPCPCGYIYICICIHLKALSFFCCCAIHGMGSKALFGFDDDDQ